MPRDLIAERVAHLQAKREAQAKEFRPYLPDTAGPTALAKTPCRGMASPTYQRAMLLQGERLWREAGCTKEDFLKAARAAREKGQR